MPQRPLGRLLMTVPDRLPYGESDIPDASVYQASRSIVTSPLGPEKPCATWLPVLLNERAAQSLQQPRSPRAMLPCEVTLAFSRMSR